MFEIHFEGDSKEVLSAFPHDVKVNLGYALRRLQNGEEPTCPTRSMASIGRGVFELKDGDERTWYRVIYLSVIDDVIHVLHCFEKDTRKTERTDVELARKRLGEVRQRIQEHRKHEGHRKQGKPRR